MERMFNSCSECYRASHERLLFRIVRFLGVSLFMKGMTLMKIVAENFRKGRSSYVEVIGLSDHLNLLTKETAHCPWMKCGGRDHFRRRRFIVSFCQQVRFFAMGGPTENKAMNFVLSFF